MEIVRLVLLVVHLLGFAALTGGILVQLREPTKRVNSLMRDGAGTAVVAGVALVGVLEADSDVQVDHAKIGVKLVIGLIILALVMMNLRRPRIPDGLFWLIAALTLANLCVAVFWAPAHGSY
ncbi:MAG: hypothetical protein QM638_14905 [Nocardioides sp.]|uniref:hypothetical protein n=1 Tax=Nocardioides sp. TaxID=35761 RepID=UPI0039E28395